mmetsp:Transcript_19951/g.64776  ORF Transcript_19951/g.64776 Transcript_19951/m.64776 type:complete len:424 (+) Transcript_19951:114-1385(+)
MRRSLIVPAPSHPQPTANSQRVSACLAVPTSPASSVAHIVARSRWACIRALRLSALLRPCRATRRCLHTCPPAAVPDRGGERLIGSIRRGSSLHPAFRRSPPALPHDGVLQELPEVGRLLHQHLGSLAEEHLRRHHAGRLDREDEVIPHSRQLDPFVPLRLPNALAAHGARARPRGHCGHDASDVLDVKDPHRAFRHQLPRHVARHLLLEGHLWQQAVRCGRDGRPLGVRLASPLLTPGLQLDVLTRPQLGDQDVVVDWPNRRVAEPLLLPPLLYPHQRARQNPRVDHLVGPARTAALPACAAAACGPPGAATESLRPLTLDIQAEGDDVVLVVILLPHALSEEPGVCLDRDEPKAVRQHLVLRHRRVVQHEHLVDGHRRHIGKQDAPERVSYGGINPDDVKDDLLLIQALDLNLQVSAESLD